MPKYLGIIEKTERYYVRIRAPSKAGANLWGHDFDYDDFVEDREPDICDINLREVIDPQDTRKRRVKGKWRIVSALPVDVKKSWFAKGAHVIVDEDGDEQL